MGRVLSLAEQSGTSHDLGSVLGRVLGGILACTATAAAAGIATGSLVVDLIGWRLLLKRKVYRCRNCGVIIEWA